MLRPLLTFGTLALAALLLAPTVLSVHDAVENLHIKRDLPHLWKWDDTPPPPPLPPKCDNEQHPTTVEITKWPSRMAKGEPFTLGGVVTMEGSSAGVAGIHVDVFLNETKTEPGEFVGTATSQGGGAFILTTSVPHDLQARHYNLVANAKAIQIGCKIYHESWSDPEIDVTARTSMSMQAPPRMLLGRNGTISGTIIDNVGGPVRDASIQLSLDGRTFTVVSDEEGRFTLSYAPRHPGNLSIAASYAGSNYYQGSAATTTTLVSDEAVVLDGVDAGVRIVRSQPTNLSGQVFVPANRSGAPLVFTFTGLAVHTCSGCPAVSSFSVKPDANGTFAANILVDSSRAPGPFTLVVSGGGLKAAQNYSGALFVPVTMSLDAQGTGLVSRFVAGSVTLVDDAQRPVPGDVGVAVADHESWGSTDAKGAYAFRLAAACGPVPTVATYNGTSTYLSASATAAPTACPFFALLPPWLVAIPWWGWLLAVVSPFLLVFAWRRWREARADVISLGPPLRVAFTDPDDAAAGIVGIGEPVTLTVYLEEPLPAGHKLRVGPHGQLTEPEIGPDLRASFTFTPEKLGIQPLRAEIVDGRGRVVTRRTGRLRVVHYAAEIERRYRDLKRQAVGDDAEETISPRGFEAWLRERAPTLDPGVASRLVAIFEEADYGPRDAGRRELLAYLEAQSAAQEVMPVASG